MSNGKGDSPRPLSVDSETFANNWERIFAKKKTSPIDPEYEKAVKSGMFWERYPDMTGIWEKDKTEWYLQNLTRNAQELGLYDTPE